jgi:membrane protease YdiL (CAAX protease family)
MRLPELKAKLNKNDIIDSLLLFIKSAGLYIATSMLLSILFVLIFPDHKDVEYRTYIPSGISLLILCIFLAYQVGIDRLYFTSGLKSIYSTLIGILAAVIYIKFNDAIFYNAVRGHLTLLTGYRYLWVFVALVIIGPIFEEILCRGYLFEYSRHKYGTIAACIISLSISLLMHYEIGSDNTFYIHRAIDLCIGFSLFTLAYTYGGLFASIIIHGFMNWYGFLY